MSLQKEVLTCRYIRIIEENLLFFIGYKDCCKEAVEKEMERNNEKNKNVEVWNKPR